MEKQQIEGVKAASSEGGSSSSSSSTDALLLASSSASAAASASASASASADADAVAVAVVNKESSSSGGVFDSVFAPPSKVLGVNSWSWRNNDPKSWNASPVDVAHSSEGEGGSHLLPDKERRPIFQETLGPCSLSSSIYYGGQDIYPNSPSTGSSDSSYNFKKDGGDGEDDSNEASRGNWWQGSLYY